jgi:hypothetical protein
MGGMERMGSLGGVKHSAARPSSGSLRPSSGSLCGASPRYEGRARGELDPSDAIITVMQLQVR